jgi:hypothetical protein
MEGSNLLDLMNIDTHLLQFAAVEGTFDQVAAGNGKEKDEKPQNDQRKHGNLLPVSD